MRPYLFACCILLGLTYGARAQQPGEANINRLPARSGPNLRASSAFTAEAEKRLKTLIHIKGFADRASEFRDNKARARTLARLASVIWDADRDQARQLFVQAFNGVQLAETSKEKRSERSLQTGLPLREWLHLKWEVLGMISHKDTALADRLVHELSNLNGAAFNADDRSALYLYLAKLVAIDRPGDAIGFVKQGLAAGKVDGLGVLFTLAELRKQNRPAADALFLTAIDRMQASPFVEATELLYLGAYVFTSPGMDPADFEGVANVAVGHTMIPLVNVERPDAPLALVQAYLNGAVTILSRQAADPRQKQAYYVAAYQLLPKAQKYIPARARELAMAMTALLPDIPQALAQDSTYAIFHETGEVDLEKELSKFGDEKSRGTINTLARDTQCLRLICDMYREGDFSRAGALLLKVSDIALREQLTTLISFGEANRLLEKKKVDMAEEMANRLPPGIERAILWLGIARARLNDKCNARAAEALNAAVQDARRVEGARQPFLLLSAAGEYARFDEVMNLVLLQEAVKSFNSQEGETWERVGFDKEVATEEDGRVFPLDVKGIEPKFSVALSKLASERFNQTESILMNLDNEALLGRAFIVLSSFLLN